MGSQRNIEIDLSKMSLEELEALVAKIERVLELRRFEDGLSKAVREYQARDPQLIRL